MAAGDTSGRTLEYTPTWALAAVCFVIISVSILIEQSIHILTNWLKRHQKTALYDAVDRLKSELMLLGFLSLLLAVTQEPISSICIPNRLANIMLPCRKEAETQTTTVENVERLAVGLIGNFLPMYNNTLWTVPHRRLADDNEEAADDGGATTSTDSCSEGKAPLVSQEGLQQLHIFIFVLAVMQIVYCVLTMALGRAKMRRWKAWEEETQTTEYQAENDSPGKQHLGEGTSPIVQIHQLSCGLQFFHSVAKVDYLTLRHGFIATHLSARHNHFNFQKYIQTTLDEDFKVIVSVRILLITSILLKRNQKKHSSLAKGLESQTGHELPNPVMWLIVAILMLVDVHGWNVYLWVSYVPLLIVLVLGTKLEVIVARLALQLKNQNSVIIGTPVVQPHDDLFWFGRPKFVLTLLHLTLFVNAFELAFFIWVTIQFGFNSCYHEHTIIIVTRLVLAVSIQVLCSYITLPLYALVTQMGSEFKSTVLEEHMSTIIKKWHAEVKKRRKQEQYSFISPRTSVSTDWSLRNSPIDFSSHRRPSTITTDQSNNNRGEITEE